MGAGWQRFSSGVWWWFLCFSLLMDSLASMRRYQNLSQGWLFLLVQDVLLVDFVHGWNDNWVSKDEQFWYEILAKFFNSMESSIRLLKLKGLSPTLPNICASIQNLTKRRFTYAHLAQLKYIMPEVIMIKKVHLQDEVTSCMKPDLHITLQVDALEDTLKGNGNVICTLDPNLSQSLTTNLAIEIILELASRCLAPTRQKMPIMRRCAEVLWGICRITGNFHLEFVNVCC